MDRDVARGRRATWRAWGTEREWSADNEEIGVAGERAFAEAFGIPYEGVVGRGDGGIDFTVGAITIDVKTARKAIYLLHEADGPRRSRADVLVLAQYRPPGAELIGWAWRAELVHEPKRDFGGGVASHYLHYSRLKGMTALHELLGR